MPKHTIEHDPNEPIRTERINGETIGDNTNTVVVGWGKGLGLVQIGVSEPDATPGDRQGGHFTTIGIDEIDGIITSLKRAKRQAYGPAHTAPCVNGSICGEPTNCPE